MIPLVGRPILGPWLLTFSSNDDPFLYVQLSAIGSMKKPLKPSRSFAMKLGERLVASLFLVTVVLVIGACAPKGGGVKIGRAHV